MTTGPRVLFVSGSGSGNTLRYRVRYAEEALRSTGVRTAAVHFTEPQLQSWAERADAVVLYRTPASRRVLRFIEHARTRLGLPVSFDIDDRVFLAEHIEHVPFLERLPPSKRALFEADAERRGRCVPFVDRATGTTVPVVEDYADLTSAPAEVLPNGVTATALALADAARRSTAPGTVRIGYFSGSATHDDDWAVAEPAVVELLRSHPHVELWLVGPLRPSSALDAVADQVRDLDTVPWQQLPSLLASVDLCLAPLDVTPFTEGKSAIKWLEAALVRTPTLATATRPFRDAVVEGTDALLVPDGGDWLEPLTRLVGDADLRCALGEAAREGALTRFGPDLQAERYRASLDALLTGPRAEVDLDALRRLAASEPRPRTLGIPLEPYTFPTQGASAGLPAPRGAAAFDGFRRGYRAAARTGVRYAKGVRRRALRFTRPGDRAGATDPPPSSGRPSDRPKDYL